MTTPSRAGQGGNFLEGDPGGFSRRIGDNLSGLGSQATFFVKALAAIPYALRAYRPEIYRLLSDISWGRALLVGGGIFGVMLLLSAFVGASVGIAG